MEMIAPLAKILAEANGIDWRKIHGTGEGGQIVEQDILNHLHRIMTGEEEPPPTPVDLPPADWAGDVASMQSMDMSALAAAGVESADIAEIMATTRQDAQGVQAAHDLSSDAMDFELELDEDDQDDTAITRDPEEMAAQPRDADYAGSEAFAFDTGGLPAAPGGLDPVGGVAPVGHAGMGLPSVDPTLAQTAPHVPAENMGLPADAPADVAALSNDQPGWHDAPVTPPAPPAATGGHAVGGLLSSLYGGGTPAPAQPEPTPPPAEPARPQFTPPEPVQPQFTQPEPAQPEPVQFEPVAEPVQFEPAAQPEVATPPAAPAPVTEPVLDIPTPAAEEVAAPTPEPVPAPEPTLEPAPVFTPVPAAPISAPAAQAVQTEYAPAPVDSRHATLRLAFDAAALAAARTHLSEHFDGRLAPLAVFVARAAARHASTLGLQGVGVYGVGDEITPVATPNLTGDFRAAVRDLQGAEGGQPADLMVVDAGELGLDELQLPGGGVTLTLGRVRDGRATLTLTGPVNVRRGAEFLQNVAELLETPIRLML